MTDSVVTAARLIAAIYKYSCVGSNAHIVVDDHNVDNESIRWCLDEALKRNAHEATPDQLAGERACLELLLQLTVPQRLEAIGLAEWIEMREAE